MGKRGFNWKARQVVEAEIDNNPTKKIKLEIESKGNYDESNELVLPSIKRTTKIKNKKEQHVKILSKKQRKRLEKIVERKEKKKQRTELLDELIKIQAKQEDLNQLVSLSTIQTKGIKKHFIESKRPKSDNKIENNFKINSIKGSRKKLLNYEDNKPLYDKNNPNIVGLDSESSESENDSNLELNENVEDDEIKLDDDKNDDFKEKEKDKTEMKRKNVEINLDKVEKKPAIFVDVVRDEKIQEARLKLPILAEEQVIMETINENSIIIIAGETGSGKTTQVPQFLYEAGYASTKTIAITEPRRIAAISMSKRVAKELSLSEDIVSYLIRFEGNVTDKTKIKFMTDGVLLREIKEDFLLTKYSVIILDEAHERSVHTDILIGFLSRIVPLRNKRGDFLKLIIMSATLRLKDFTENPRLFKISPPVINVEARQFPVTVHFNRRTNDDYLKESLRKVAKIHGELPEGGILVFLTGRREVTALVGKLKKMFPVKNKNLKLKGERNLKKKVKIVPKIDLDDFDVINDEDVGLSDEEFDLDDSEIVKTGDPLWVLPLYSQLNADKQLEVFKNPPEGCRLCVISTNISETSLTIPNIKYVVDSGKTKIKLYDKITGTSRFLVTWTSKASANQRAGRAGRTSPGHCYRLYSSAVFNDVFKDFERPEIQEKPADDLYLYMKCMGIDKIINFPFPTAPDLMQLKSAERTLEILGLIDNKRITELGKVVSKYPVLPRFGKMLALSNQFDLLPYTILLISALSVQELFKNDSITTYNKMAKNHLKTGNFYLLGDLMILLTTIGGAEIANLQGKLTKFCSTFNLREKAIKEIRKIRLQLTKEINLNHSDLNLNLTVDPNLTPPSDLQAKLLRQIVLSGMGDKIAQKIEINNNLPNDQKKLLKNAYRTEFLEEPVFLSKKSIFKPPLPEFITFQELYETDSNEKIYLRTVSSIEPEWLVSFVPKLCNLSEPLNDPEPSYDEKSGKIRCKVTGTFGKGGFVLPGVIEIDFPDSSQIYKWFGRYFLEGLVCGRLKKFSRSLLNPSYTVVKPWAKLQPKVVRLVQKLAGDKVDCKLKLEQEFKRNKNYLLEEYLMWLPQSLHGQVTLLWPPL
nr:probable ATP-dependent RNA helicase kurz [Onthophagus taurus]